MSMMAFGGRQGDPRSSQRGHCCRQCKSKEPHHRTGDASSPVSSRAFQERFIFASVILLGPLFPLAWWRWLLGFQPVICEAAKQSAQFPTRTSTAVCVSLRQCARRTLETLQLSRSSRRCSVNARTTAAVVCTLGEAAAFVPEPSALAGVDKRLAFAREALVFHSMCTPVCSRPTVQRPDCAIARCRSRGRCWKHGSGMLQGPSLSRCSANLVLCH